MARKYAGTGLQEIRGRIEVVNYSTQRLVVKARGYGTLKKVKVQSGIQLGTTDRPVIVAGDIALLRRQPSGRWICYSILHKDRCATSTAEVIEVEVSTASSYIAQQASALETPLDLRYPPIEPLGQITLPEFRFPDPTTFICGLPPCIDCAPGGFVEGYVLQISSDATYPTGCYIWGPRGGVIGGTIFVMFENELFEFYYYRIDNYVSASITPALSFFRLGLPQDALISIETGIEYASDGVNFSSVETIPSEERTTPLLSNGLGTAPNIASDHSYRGYQYVMTYTPATETEFATPIPAIAQAVYDAWNPATGDGKDIALFDTDTEFFADYGEVFIYISTSGGATWTKYSLGYLMDLLPTRLYGGVANVSQTNWESPASGLPGCCTYADVDCSVTVPQQIPRKTYIYNVSDDVIYFAMCEAQLGSDPWLAGTDVACSVVPDFRYMQVTSKSNGLGCYAVGQVNFEAELTDTGESVSPYAPVGYAFNNYDFGNVRTEVGLLVWNVLNDGSSTSKYVTLGYLGETSVIELTGVFTNIADPDEIYVQVRGYDAFFNNQYGVYLFDWTAGTLTDLSAPFTDLIPVTTSLSTNGACVSKNGSYFQALYNSDFSVLTLWRYDGTWTSTDITGEIDNPSVIFSYVDEKVYLVDNQASGTIGVSDDDGDTWTFHAVTGQTGIYPDTY